MAPAFPRDSLPPSPSPGDNPDDDDNDALRGETVKSLLTAPPEMVAVASSWPSPLSKLSSLVTPKPPSLEVRPRACNCCCWYGEEGRGDNELLVRSRGEDCFCRCADSLARSEEAERAAVSVRRGGARFRGGTGSDSAAAAVAGRAAAPPRLPALLAGENAFGDVVPGWERRGDRPILRGCSSCCCSSCCCCCC